MVGMIPGLYTCLATGAIAGVLAFGAGWQIQSWKYGEKIEAMKLATSNEVIEALRRNKVLTETITTKYQEALNESRAREVILRRNVAVAIRESDGLREQASEAARRIAEAPPASIAEYATTVSGLFADCSRDYQEMAGKASGHAADVRTLVEAWPVTKE